MIPQSMDLSKWELAMPALSGRHETQMTSAMERHSIYPRHLVGAILLHLR